MSERIEKCQRVGCLAVPFHGYGYCSNACEQIDVLETENKRLREAIEKHRKEVVLPTVYDKKLYAALRGEEVGL